MESTKKNKTTNKFYIFRLFLIILVLIWCLIFILSKSINNKYIKVSARLDNAIENCNNLQIEKPLVPLPRFFLIYNLPEISGGKDGNPYVYTWEQIRNKPDSFEFHLLDKKADIALEPSDYFYARLNLIELHSQVAIGSDASFFEKNAVFEDFVNNLSKDLLIKIHRGITGQTADFKKLENIPISFHEFLLNIGYDSITCQPIHFNERMSYEKRKTECEEMINSIATEKLILEMNPFLHLDLIIVTLILIGLSSVFVLLIFIMK